MIPLLASLALAAPTLAQTAPDLFLAMLEDATVTSPSPEGEVRTADLAWTTDVHIETQATPGELVARFDRPLGEAVIQRFAEEAGKDLADLRWNDDSLVLRPAMGRRLDVLVLGRVLRVRFLPDPDSETAPADLPPKRDAGIDLAIARAQADVAAGYPGRARRRLTVMGERHPDDRQLQRALADAEAADGATASAAWRYRALDADDQPARRVMAEAGGNVTGGALIRGGKAFFQAEGDLSGTLPLSSALSMGVGVRHIQTHADSVAGPAGVLTDVDSRSTMGDLLAFLRIGPAVRLELQGSVQFDKDVAGAGARLFAGSAERQARLTLAWRLPDVSTPEQSALGGHISRIGIGGTLRLTPELTVQADAAWNGYGLAGTGVRSRTFTLTGGIDYMLRRRSPILIAAYRLDAEYVDRIDLRPNGLAFVPLSDRENHSFQLVASTTLAKVQLTGAAGWTVDRLGGGDGPSASVGAAARLGDKWRLEASGGVSSVSRPGFPGRQLFLRFVLTRHLGRT